MVDDVTENRAFLVKVLDGLGFEMAEATNGIEGLNKAQEQLKWRYELPQTGPFAPQEDELLVVPSESEMKTLHHLAQQGNMQDLLSEVSRITELDERYHAFANQLRTLANAYQSKAILRLVEQHMHPEGHGDTLAKS